MKYDIRRGTKADIPAVLGLVKELAVFEKAPDAVTAKLDDYRSAYDSGLISYFVAEMVDEIVGIALFYDTFSTWKGKMLYLEDFVVKDHLRSLGIGQALFDAVVSEAKARNCKLMKWQVLDWNTGALRFYERIGAEIEKEWWNGKLWL